MSALGWSTPQLAEFVAFVSAAASERSAALAAVERAAETLDADVAAIVCRGEALAAVGYAEGAAPVDELVAVTPGGAGASLEVPGVGVCPAAAVALDYPPGATLLIARPHVLTREEAALLRGMARVASMTMRTFRVLDNERAARAEVERLARDQAALRRVATLVARGDTPEAVFAAVAEEVGRLLGATATAVVRYQADGQAHSVGAWNSSGRPVFFPTARLGGRNVATLVWESGRPARVAGVDLDDGSESSSLGRSVGAQSAVGVPVSVGDRLWGMLAVATFPGQAALPADTEKRLADFAELAATAIANAQARDELRRVADEQAALRRIAMLVAHGVPPGDILEAVAAEVHRLLRPDVTTLTRIESDGRWTTAASRGAHSGLVPGASFFPAGPGLGSVLGGRPRRVETRRDGTGADDLLGSEGVTAWVVNPIVLAGQTWGVLTVLSRHAPLAPDTESRLANFTELVAAAIANAEAQAELTASRARVVATADATRRRIVRDLHDGAQQRLVHTIITLKLARRAQAGDGEQAAETLLDEALGHAEQANAALRELVHGILPSTLARGGLAAGVEALVSSLRVPARVNVVRDRFAPEIEANAYFVVAEALTNVAKHSAARSANVATWVQDGFLRVEVRDDGVGGARSDGSGLLGLRDRVLAVGGQLRVASPPGAGTCVEAQLPLGANPKVSGFPYS